ncbi:MAG: hypothetical protein ACFFFT_04925 [Candidatus Thorarchaeota archaeon]
MNPNFNYCIHFIITIVLLATNLNAQQGLSKSNRQVSTELKNEINVYASISYPTLQQNGPDIVDFSEPENFDKEGIYIYKDDSNIWNIKVTGLMQQNLNGDFYSKENITIISDINNSQVKNTATSISINLKDNRLRNPLVTQFIVNNNEIETNFNNANLITNDKIYLGKFLKKPKNLQFVIKSAISNSNSSVNLVPHTSSQNTEQRINGGGTIKKKD